MLIKVDVNSDLYRQIQKLVEDGKYDDIYQFISIALKNQIQEEQAGPEKIGESGTEPIKSIPQRMRDTILDRQNEIKLLLGETPTEKSEINPIEQHTPWNFYNRFFPIKIVLRQLAIMVKAEEADKVWSDFHKARNDLNDQIHDLKMEAWRGGLIVVVCMAGIIGAMYAAFVWLDGYC